MAESKDQKDELRDWYKTLLNTTVRELVRTRAVSGAAIEAAPMWASTQNILIAKVWDATQKSQFVWAIAGEKAVIDHIPGSMAVTPQEAARHFALKWQMDAERLLKTAQEPASAQQGEEVVKDYAAKLIEKAELLYDLCERDEIWKQRTTH